MQLGKEFGLEGQKLLEFVREQQKLEEEKEEQQRQLLKEQKLEEEERAERQRREEEERVERQRREEEERAERQRREEEERAERQRREEEETEERRRRQDEEREARRPEREIRKLQHEADLMRQKEAAEAAKREHELELARLAATNGVGRTAERDDRAKAPKLPAFADSKDDLDAYLQRFERFAYTAKWNRTGWASKLSALLSGRALEVYSRLSEEAARDYGKVKIALMKSMTSQNTAIVVSLERLNRKLTKVRTSLSCDWTDTCYGG